MGNEVSYLELVFITGEEKTVDKHRHDHQWIVLTDCDQSANNEESKV